MCTQHEQFGTFFLVLHSLAQSAVLLQVQTLVVRRLTGVGVVARHAFVLVIQIDMNRCDPLHPLIHIV